MVHLMLSTMQIRPQAMDLKRFAKLMGYLTAANREFKANLTTLTEKRYVKLQQSGFIGRISKKIDEILKTYNDLEKEV